MIWWSRRGSVYGRSASRRRPPTALSGLAGSRRQDLRPPRPRRQIAARPQCRSLRVGLRPASGWLYAARHPLRDGFAVPATPTATAASRSSPAVSTPCCSAKQFQAALRGGFLFGGAATSGEKPEVVVTEGVHRRGRPVYDHLVSPRRHRHRRWRVRGSVYGPARGECGGTRDLSVQGGGGGA